MTNITPEKSALRAVAPSFQAGGLSPASRAAQADTHSSLRRATKQSYNTVDVASATTNELLRQDERICSIDHSLNETDYQLRRSERHIRATASWRGMIANWFTRTPTAPGHQAASTAEVNATATQANTKCGQTAHPAPDEGTSSPPPETLPAAVPCKLAGGEGSRAATCSSCVGSRAAQRPTPQHARLSDERVSVPTAEWSGKDARLLEELHANVLHMREHAIYQNALLARQNEALDNTASKASVVQSRLDRNHSKVRKLL